ncbi:unnamed protein product [Peniophora sp. CBMAI 1063]|nr:unnamed protein product [Peniophora sp. CBMAI 1063]
MSLSFQRDSRVLLASSAGFPRPLFSFECPFGPLDGIKTERSWAFAQAASYGRLHSARARSRIGDTGGLMWYTGLDDASLLAFGRVVAEQLERACCGKAMLAGCLRPSDRVRDPGDFLLWLSLEHEGTKMLLAIAWRLPRVWDPKTREALAALSATLTRTLEEYCAIISMTPSNVVRVWSTEFVNEQESALAWSLNLRSRSVSEAAMDGWRSWQAINQALLPVRRVDAHAFGMLLLGVERQALGLPQTVPHYPDEMPCQTAAVLALLDQLSDGLPIRA